MDIVKTLKKLLGSAPLGKNGKPEIKSEPSQPENPETQQYW